MAITEVHFAANHYKILSCHISPMTHPRENQFHFIVVTGSTSQKRLLTIFSEGSLLIIRCHVPLLSDHIFHHSRFWAYNLPPMIKI